MQTHCWNTKSENKSIKSALQQRMWSKRCPADSGRYVAQVCSCLLLKNKAKKKNRHHWSHHKDRVMLKTIWRVQQVRFHENVIKNNSNLVSFTRFYSQKHKTHVFSLSCQLFLASCCFPTRHPASNSSPVLPPDSLASFLSDGFMGNCWSEGAYGRKQQWRSLPEVFHGCRAAPDNVSMHVKHPGWSCNICHACVHSHRPVPAQSH